MTPLWVSWGILGAIGLCAELGIVRHRLATWLAVGVAYGYVVIGAATEPSGLATQFFLEVGLGWALATVCFGLFAAFNYALRSAGVWSLGDYLDAQDERVRARKDARRLRKREATNGDE